MKYAIAVARVTRRASIADGGQTVVEYVPDLRLGTASTRKAIKAAFMRSMDSTLANVDDDWAARHFDQQARNLGHFKVMAVTNG